MSSALYTTPIPPWPSTPSNSNPAMPGMKVNLTRMSGKGKGTTSFELSRLMPSQGSSEFHADFDMAMEMAGQKQAMTMKMDMTVQTESK